jgi:hypothetical protein
MLPVCISRFRIRLVLILIYQVILFAGHSIALNWLDIY